MIKHFQVYPLEFNKNDLFEEQKIFLIYLMGLIPSIEDWTLQVDYKTRKEKIKNIKSIKLEKTDIDLAQMHNKDIDELKKERLIEEKEKQLKELNEKFGIEEDKKEIKIKGLPDNEKSELKSEKEKLWDVLQGKGLIKKVDK